MNEFRHGLLLVVLLSLLAGMAFAADAFMSSSGGARYQDLKTGDGHVAELGDVATIHFVGWLDDHGNKGREIYNTRMAGQAVSFVIGTDRVMPGWNEGVIGMRQGGKRLLLLPPSLGYGAKGVEGVVPSDASLIFVIELVGLEQ